MNDHGYVVELSSEKRYYLIGTRDLDRVKAMYTDPTVEIVYEGPDFARKTEDHVRIYELFSEESRNWVYKSRGHLNFYKYTYLYTGIKKQSVDQDIIYELLLIVADEDDVHEWWREEEEVREDMIYGGKHRIKNARYPDGFHVRCQDYSQIEREDWVAGSHGGANPFRILGDLWPYLPDGPAKEHLRKNQTII